MINVFLLALMAITAWGVIRLRSLFAAVMLFGIYSLLSACFFTTMDAVDVAFTEAAVGAGISTVLMLGTLSLTQRTEKRVPHRNLLALTVVTITGAVLVYATIDMPYYGDPDAPIHRHVGEAYLERTDEDMDIPNVVTAVVAGYRAYDTLGETAVIFTAAVGVMALLATGWRAGADRSGEQHP